MTAKSTTVTKVGDFISIVSNDVLRTITHDGVEYTAVVGTPVRQTYKDFDDHKRVDNVINEFNDVIFIDYEEYASRPSVLILTPNGNFIVAVSVRNLIEYILGKVQINENGRINKTMQFSLVGTSVMLTEYVDNFIGETVSASELQAGYEYSYNGKRAVYIGIDEYNAHQFAMPSPYSNDIRLAYSAYNKMRMTDNKAIKLNEFVLDKFDELQKSRAVYYSYKHNIGNLVLKCDVVYFDGVLRELQVLAEIEDMGRVTIRTVSRPNNIIKIKSDRTLDEREVELFRLLKCVPNKVTATTLDDGTVRIKVVERDNAIKK